MPVISSKVNQQELDAVAEYANRHGITVSNLIRMVLVREVAAPRVLSSQSLSVATQEESNNAPPSDVRKSGNALVDLVRAGKQKSRLEQIMESRR
jgi:hypothetical protein